MKNLIKIYKAFAIAELVSEHYEKFGKLLIQFYANRWQDSKLGADVEMRILIYLNQKLSVNEIKRVSKNKFNECEKTVEMMREKIKKESTEDKTIIAVDNECSDLIRRWYFRQCCGPLDDMTHCDIVPFYTMQKLYEVVLKIITQPNA